MSAESASAQAPQSARQPPPASRSPDAERRQLSVLFCDLVDSTRIAARLDPEDWREAIAAYQESVGAVVARHEGHVAQYLGDGILVYFGYPHAHEDDPSRAVRTGLGILAAVAELGESSRWQELGLDFASRIGIHTGPTVIGTMGDVEHQEALAIGSTPNVAARLQGEADPNEVVVSARVHRLTAGEFLVEDRGVPSLKGLDEPMHTYRVIEPSGVRSRLRTADHLTPFVGREHDLGLLCDAWEQVCEGIGHAVLVCGDAGIGKSRLALAFREKLAENPHTWLECAASPQTRNTAFAPILDLVRQGLEFDGTEDVGERRERLRDRAQRNGLEPDETTDVIGRLLGLHEAGASEERETSAEDMRDRAIEMLVEWTLSMGQQQPVLLFVEDLHWCDPSTVDFLGELMQRVSGAQVMVLLTARPEFEAQWPAGESFHQLVLSRLSRRMVGEMIGELAGVRALSEGTIARIAERTDGMPLFVEELTRAVMEDSETETSDSNTPHGGDAGIPETLQDLLMARLDRLGPAREVAQVAAVIGREFSIDLLARVLARDPDDLVHSLRSAVDAGIIFRRGVAAGTRYVFKHALIQDAAYQSLLRANRRRHHRAIADALVAEAASTEQPEVIAFHYTECGRAADAIPYWRSAGQRALECSAHVEAIAYLEQGLGLIEKLDPTPERAQLELQLSLALGPPLMASRGYADPRMEEVYGRAREICRELGDPPEFFPVMFGLWTYHCVRAQHGQAEALGKEMTNLALQVGDDGLLLEADVASGITHFYLGELHQARERLMRVEELFDEKRDAGHLYVFGQDPRAASLAHLMVVDWMLGDFSGALAARGRAVALARRLDHPFSVSYALSFAAWFHCLRGDAETCLALTEESIEVSGPRTLAVFLAISEILQGWALTTLGRTNEGLDRLDGGMRRFAGTASNLIVPCWYGLQAKALAEAGRPKDALAVVDEALLIVERTGERNGEADLQLARAELLRATGASPERVESEMRAALDTAEGQGAKSLVLQAAMALYRICAESGHESEGREFLAAVRSEHRETTDEPVLMAADRLLVR